LAGFSEHELYEKTTRKPVVRKMNKPEGLDLAGQTFTGEVALRRN